MTRAEALDWLHRVKVMLADTHHVQDAWIVEDVEHKVGAGLLPSQYLTYARMVLPSGRRGRVALVLNSPHTARVLAWLCRLLLELGVSIGVNPPEGRE